MVFLCDLGMLQHYMLCVQMSMGGRMSAARQHPRRSSQSTIQISRQMYLMMTNGKMFESHAACRVIARMLQEELCADIKQGAAAL